MDELLRPTEVGMYSPVAGFHIDPIRPVPWAVLTHAHADHARPGSRRYLAAAASGPLLRMRLGGDAEIELMRFGERRTVGGVAVSFHPAGHIRGSAQVRLEHRGRVAVVSGDYKLGEDPTCEPWEPVRCHLFVTESTFALPVYRWPRSQDVFASIRRWCAANRQAGRCSVLFGYAIGKSQRLIAGLVGRRPGMDDATPLTGPIYTHGAVERGVAAYRESGVALPETVPVASVARRHDWSGAVVIGVPSARGTPWARRFGPTATAMASGWMAIRGALRRRNVDRGFVLSDHVDWPDLLTAVSETGAEEVWATHGYAAAVARFLRGRGIHAKAVDDLVRRSDDDSDLEFGHDSDLEFGHDSDLEFGHDSGGGEE